MATENTNEAPAQARIKKLGVFGRRPREKEVVALEEPIYGQRNAIFADMTCWATNLSDALDTATRLSQQTGQMVLFRANGVLVPVYGGDANLDAAATKARALDHYQRTVNPSGQTIPQRELVQVPTDDFVDMAAAQFRRERSINPLLHLPLLRKLRAEQIVDEVADRTKYSLGGANGSRVANVLIGKRHRSSLPSVL